jgi:hypothetical protein
VNLPAESRPAAEVEMTTQAIVETILGRLITDEDFRSTFLASPLEVCRAHALELGDEEIDALAQMDPVALAVFAGCLDPKIVRAAGGTVARSAVVRGRR